MKRENKKKDYEDATAEVVLISTTDIITTSEATLDPDGNYDDKAWT